MSMPSAWRESSGPEAEQTLNTGLCMWKWAEGRLVAGYLVMWEGCFCVVGVRTALLHVGDVGGLRYWGVAAAWKLQSLRGDCMRAH